MLKHEEENIANLRQKLRRSGLKLTTQRESICKTFFAKEGHRTAEEILLESRQFDAKISLATIYRTLKLLQEFGFAKAHNFQDGQALFEPVFDNHEHHDHLICTHCGAIIEFFDEQIEILQSKVARAHDFKITNHKMELYGLCKKCQ
ncbi:MAG: transcriptional repressor [Myxococcales bacterium]|nr:transcriptional repressor [Myxococcales bacterium]USN50289.1 MAG: transcriptional repressor [Myxococcales bacterium]